MKHSLRAEFEAFVALYPRKQDLVRAWDAWQREAPDLAVVRDALAWQTKQPAWLAGYVPLPANWISGRRFEDEPFHVAPQPPPKAIPAIPAEGQGESYHEWRQRVRDERERAEPDRE